MKKNQVRRCAICNTPLSYLNRDTVCFHHWQHRIKTRVKDLDLKEWKDSGGRDWFPHPPPPDECYVIGHPSRYRGRRMDARSLIKGLL